MNTKTGPCGHISFPNSCQHWALLYVHHATLCHHKSQAVLDMAQTVMGFMHRCVHQHCLSGSTLTTPITDLSYPADWFLLTAKIILCIIHTCHTQGQSQTFSSYNLSKITSGLCFSDRYPQEGVSKENLQNPSSVPAFYS